MSLPLSIRQATEGIGSERTVGDIVNLRRARKSRARTQAERQAAENRARFGRTKEERHNAFIKEQLETDRLEGHRLPSDDEG